MTVPVDSVEHVLGGVYKRESSRILAVLTRVFGTHNLDMAEDVMQEAFGKALQDWERNGVPSEPAAWIFQTAKNRAIDLIRAHNTRTKFAEDISHFLKSEWTLGYAVDQQFRDTAIADDQLHMIFLCCRPDMDDKNRIPLILRTLCGFTVPAIARALLLSEANVKKRLLRTRELLKGAEFALPSVEQLPAAMNSVHTALYLLFNEGCYCTDERKPMRIEFCQDAMALARLLVNTPRVLNRDTLGLLALMYLHLARVPARIDSDGAPVPLDLQDRRLWNPAHIETGARWLSMTEHVVQGASGRFQWEAMIALEHCRAGAFHQTDWPTIVQHYEKLVDLTRSPMAELNHAVALGYAGSPRRGILCVERLIDLAMFRRSHVAMAALAHLHAMLGQRDRAYQSAQEAARRGGTQREQRLMLDQVERLLDRAKVEN